MGINRDKGGWDFFLIRFDKSERPVGRDGVWRSRTGQQLARVDGLLLIYDNTASYNRRFYY